MDPSPPTSDEQPAARDLTFAKAGLRRDLRARRREHVSELPETMRALMFLRPPGPVTAVIPQDATVGLYAAAPDEAPTTAYMRWLWENGRRVALPWFADRTAPMRFRLHDNPFYGAPLLPGPFSVPQPGADAEEVVPDVVFVPLVGFTAAGDRLGQGGGHYDRWLAAHPETLAIGLAWDCQLVETLPREQHDRPLAAVVTPTRFYEVGRG